MMKLCRVGASSLLFYVFGKLFVWLMMSEGFLMIGEVVSSDYACRPAALVLDSVAEESFLVT